MDRQEKIRRSVMSLVFTIGGFIGGLGIGYTIGSRPKKKNGNGKGKR